MLKRTSLEFVNNTLKKKTNWKILDIGCGHRANAYATVIADIQDLSHLYREKNFVKITDKKLPFKDREFDFIIASHVIEHVHDFEFFINDIKFSYRNKTLILSKGNNTITEKIDKQDWMKIIFGISSYKGVDFILTTNNPNANMDSTIM